jgi:hypothetical protein
MINYPEVVKSEKYVGDIVGMAGANSLNSMNTCIISRSMAILSGAGDGLRTRDPQLGRLML